MARVRKEKAEDNAGKEDAGFRWRAGRKRQRGWGQRQEEAGKSETSRRFWVEDQKEGRAKAPPYIAGSSVRRE
ncbi:MAG: hypothetical protein DMG41_07430 [Acidobacteria bacterium]|nr:MAG: hypothetical protein AUH13_10320 [Acidobacteria bacterium 13_2_20CM_58_27]PYT65959.1 MAG: hypothetical protein DMG42_30795 [Acidobacteriota bacterium]PYT89695.1 MAG: hypothetical protein DMG41_07430 [Acidobacteriota bacterium]